jgi:hypothetical protein
MNIEWDVGIDGDISYLRNSYYIKFKRGLNCLRQRKIKKGFQEWLEIFIQWETPISKDNPGIFVLLLQLVSVYIFTKGDNN